MQMNMSNMQNIHKILYTQYAKQYVNNMQNICKI